MRQTSMDVSVKLDVKPYGILAESPWGSRFVTSSK